MSQLSQTSSLGFSQETMEMILRSTSEYPLASSQPFESNPLTSLHLEGANIQENVEMNLEAYTFFRGDTPMQMSQMGHPFSQANATTSTLAMSPPENGHSFKVEPVVTPPPDCMSVIPNTPSLVVSNTDFPGNESFWVGFPEERTFPSKSAQWTYSSQLKKLFAKTRCMVPFRIGTQVPPPTGSFIQVVVIFKRPEHYKEVAERCPNHITKQKDGHPAPMHIMRCENPLTMYTTCQTTGRHYLHFPFSKPDEGNNFVQEMFQFMCFGSCPGGLNRRPVQCIFTLEFGGRVLGRRAIDLRICACPGRDRGTEETTDNKRKAENDSTTTEQPTTPQALEDSPQESMPPTPTSTTPGPATPSQLPSTSTDDEPKLTRKRSNQYVTSGFEVKSALRPKKHRPDENDDEIFTIQVKGREKYELLVKVKESLELMDLMPQAQVDAYRASCAPCGLTKTLQPQQNSESQQSTESNESEGDGTPPASVSQLISSSDSGVPHGTSSSQASQPSEVTGAVRFVLRRTVSLERKGYR